MKPDMLPAVIDPAGKWDGMPSLIARACGNARYAWDELFSAGIRNPHTRRAYIHAVRQFLNWCDNQKLELRDITPALVGNYYDALHASIPTKKQHLSALRCFFDQLVLRHAVVLNPAASVRGERYRITEGKTPEITVDQERTLLKSIRVHDLLGLRDRAIISILIYTAARIGAVASLTVQSLSHDGTQWALRFLEKGGKIRDIPVRDDLYRCLIDYLDASSLGQAPHDSPLFRRITRRSGLLLSQAMTADDMGRMLKRRMAAVKLPGRLSPHSFRVYVVAPVMWRSAATILDFQLAISGNAT
jgi:integrase/recombinase XerD